MSEDVAQADSVDARQTRRELLTTTVPARIGERLRANMVVRGQTVTEVVEEALDIRPPRYSVSAAIAAQPIAAAAYQIGKAITMISKIEPITHESVAASTELSMALDALESTLTELYAAYEAED